MDRIFGHQPAKAHLMDAVAQGRVPHGLLLVGPQGGLALRSRPTPPPVDLAVLCTALSQLKYISGGETR